jgi:rhodanese-related sulfurtransferase
MTSVPYTRIDVKEANEMIQRGDIQIVDVREQAEYDAGRIAGCNLIPVNDVLTRIDEIASDKDIVVYCAAGVRSALACEMAAAMGRTRLFNVEGGIVAWEDANLPLEK